MHGVLHVSTKKLQSACDVAKVDKHCRPRTRRCVQLTCQVIEKEGEGNGRWRDQIREKNPGACMFLESPENFSSPES